MTMPTRSTSRECRPDGLSRAHVHGGGSPPGLTDVRIRPIEASDRDALEAFYAALSEESRATRFLGAVAGIGDVQAAYFCTPDHAHREGLVAVRAGQIVGHVCIEPDGPSCAEVAVAVADSLRGRGLGRRLVDEAVNWARADGYAELSATMLAGNVPIQRLLRSLGVPITTRVTGAGTIEARLDLVGAHRAAA